MRGDQSERRRHGRDRRARPGLPRPGGRRSPPQAPIRAARDPDRGDGEGRPDPAGPDPAALDRRRRPDRGGGPHRARLPAHDRAPGSRTPACRVGRAARPGGGAGARGARSPRRGEPVPDRRPAAARGRPGGSPRRARRRAGGDQGARQQGDARAPLPRPPAAPDRPRRPRPGGGDRGPGRPDLRDRVSRRSWSRTATSPTSMATPSWSSTGSRRRRSRTPPATRAPGTSRSLCGARRRVSSSMSPTTAAGSPSRSPRAASGSPACGSGRCCSAAS